jgi:CMP-N-acetylneuraminic acid synthetase/predicted O-methyltransferase YrrM
MEIFTTIPARYGSKRVKNKNLRLMDGRPLVYYAINAAKHSKMINEIYVNTENDLIGQVAIENGVKYYKRKPELAEDAITSDEFNYDFMKNVQADIVVMVNPVAPLITGEDIDKMVSYYLENNLDTLIPVREERLHAFCDDNAINFNPESPVQSFCDAKPINFSPSGPLPMTQNIAAIKMCIWTVCIWKPIVFMKAFEEKGHAVFSGKVGLYPQDRLKAVKISTEDDFVLAELLLQNAHKWRIPKVPYDSEQVNPNYPAMWLNEIAYIEKLLLEQAQHNEPINVLEWGSGRSTIYFSKFLRKNNVKFTWSAIENFIPWYDTVDSMLENEGISDTTRCFLKSATCEERKDIQETLDMTEFLNFPFSLDKKFNLILIDARKRKECLEKAPLLLERGGSVVLHDAEREVHHPAFTLYKNGGSFVCENISPVPGGVQKLWVGSLPD